ncbi:Protein of unknown function [Kibdelosporangium aridum]|uniref:DUF3558 domain-containing protein n=1 Tax=Kibdelosporangium aridum TaxID=2030 RepID=A0A1W2D836_KIBAR|nr:Protein of unknown function [Kibdelosporangium aridum]
MGVLALVLAVAACSSAEQGTPIAQQGNDDRTSTTKPTSKTQTPSTTTSTKPARPRTIDLKQFDPCKIIEKVAPELGLPAEKLTAEAAQGFAPGSVRCAQIRNRGIGSDFGVLHAMSRSVQEHATSYLVTTPITLEGFPALVMEGNYVNDCYVGVDVADDQTLVISWTIYLENGKPAMSDVCAGTKKAAAAAMKLVAAA